MNGQTGNDYRFCPVCGALMEDGVCTECEKKAKMRGVYSAGYAAQHSANEHPVQEQTRQGGCQIQRQPQQDYGSYAPYPRQSPPQNDHHKLWLGIGIAVAVLLLLFMVTASFFYGYFIVKYTNTETPESDGSSYHYALPEEENESGAIEKSEDSGAGVPYEPEEDYVPSPEDEYYYGPCDAINEDVPYSFANQSYSYADPAQGIDIVINYLELQGDTIPNAEQLNEALKKQALYYVDNFSDSFLVGYSDSYEVYITSYVTYNDEHLVSIVMDEYIAMDEYYYRVDLYPINIDVKNGVILDNDGILKIDEAFAAEFRKRNNEQNGNIDYLDGLSDEALADQLNNKYSMIAYYTPLGMEIGMNYTSGWVTVTYKDYKEYLAKF